MGSLLNVFNAAGGCGICGGGVDRERIQTCSRSACSGYQAFFILIYDRSLCKLLLIK